jgi:hypothetical protein
MVFPRPRLFLALQLVFLMNSCKMKKFLLILLSKIFHKLWMFQFLPCLGTILASSCPASCQPSSSPPPLSESIVAVSSHLSSHSTMAPTPFCATDPALLPSESGPRERSSPAAASRPAWLRTLSLAACFAAADHLVRPQAVLLQPNGSCFQTRWSLHLHLFGAASRRSWNCFSTRR